MSSLKSAYLKIGRAEKHIGELSDLLACEEAFSYVVETDTQTLERATYAKKNEAVTDQISLIGGDVLYQLRSALDHAYGAIVRPHFPQGEGAAQFPFSRDKQGLEAAIKNRCAHKVSIEFYDFIHGLSLHGEPGGNELLYLLHEANVVDKHRSFLPTTDKKTISSAEMRLYAPDFPAGFVGVTVGACGRDIVWRGPKSVLDSIGLPGLPKPRKHELKIPIAVEVRFRVGERLNSYEPLATLKELSRQVRSVVGEMERFV